MIRFACPHCGERFKITDEYAGRSTKCRRCGQRLTVPAQSDTPPQVPPEVPPEFPSKARPVPGSGSPPEAPPPPEVSSEPSSVDPLAALAQVVQSSETVPSAAPPAPSARRPAPVPAAPLAQARPATSTGAVPTAHDPQRRILLARAGVIGGVLALVLLAAAVFGRSRPGQTSPGLFTVPEARGASQYDLSADVRKLQKIGQVLSIYASANGGAMPGHVGELVAAELIEADAFLSVTNTRGQKPRWTGKEDPFGPHRLGDFVFVYPVLDGVKLPADAVVACAARSDGDGSRTVLFASGDATIMGRRAFIDLIQSQNRLRHERWRLPAIPAALFD